jgi:putative MATE family efflux protein
MAGENGATKPARHSAPLNDRTASARVDALLRGPIFATTLRLASPTIVVLLVQTAAGLAEVYFISLLGPGPLAGATLVLPLKVTMWAVAGAGIGGGAASAVAQALGAGRKQQADALVLNALVIAVVFGLIFMTAEFLAGRAVYQALGGAGDVLDAALVYGHMNFAAAVFVWIMNVLAAMLRGSGNVIVPAAVNVASAGLVPLTAVLVFGWGPLPALGIAGAGIAWFVYAALGSVALIGYLRSAGSQLRLTFDVSQIHWRLMRRILGVGTVSAIGTAQSNITLILITGAVGVLGTHAIAGYGIATRVDVALIPVFVGFGTATLTLVGANSGARQRVRASQAAWVGALATAAIAEVVGILVAVFPGVWIGLFSNDPLIGETAAQYFRVVGPSYGFLAFGLLVYFASQGVGRPAWPVAASTVRLVMALIGWIAVGRGAGATTLFTLISAASVIYGVMNAVNLRYGVLADRPQPPALQTAS